MTLTGWASDQVRCGQEVAFDYAGAPRFRGQVSDVQISFQDGLAVLELTAAGNLARIARRKIGYGDWPAELWIDRASRIMAEAGWSAFVIDPPDASDQVYMAARLASETSVTAMLDRPRRDRRRCSLRPAGWDDPAPAAIARATLRLTRSSWTRRWSRSRRPGARRWTL